MAEPEDDDAELARAAALGDQEAFTRLVNRHRAYLHAVAYKITLHEEDALDVLQNVFLRLVEKIGDYGGRGSFRSWAAAIAANEAMTLLRRPSRRESPADPEILSGLIDAGSPSRAGDEIREAMDSRTRRRLVEAAIAQLSAQQRAIFALRLGRGMEPKEIAERLGLPGGQVRTQLHRAMERLREILVKEPA